MIRPIRVLVAHGSVSDRARLTGLLRADPGIAVIGEAADTDRAIAMTRRHGPDVVAIGIDLPAEGAIAATRRIMAETPTPVVIVADDADAVAAQLSVLRAGALAVIPKPWTSQQPGSELETQRFVSTIKALSQVKVIHHRPARPVASAPPPRPLRRGPVRIVAIAASTGGPGALQELLSALPAGFPASVLVVQHMAPGFVQGLASALDGMSPLTVRVAMQGEPLWPQTVYMAPDGHHLRVSDRSRIVLTHDPPNGGFRPSATELFESVARSFGSASAHVILTGMGRDGVAGLAVAREHGARILAQDRASSVVFGMPGEAINAGLADAVLPLRSIADELVALTQT